MPELIFINEQDESGHNKHRIKRHVANAIHRKRRQAEVLRYREEAKGEKLQIQVLNKPEKPSASPALTVSELENASETQSSTGLEDEDCRHLVRDQRNSPQRPRRYKKQGLMLRWRVGAPTAITPRGDDLQIEFVLNQSFNWMLEQYTYSWSTVIRRDPTVFDMSNRIEIFREAFYVVSDLLALQKMNAAFTVLKHTLDFVPKLFRDSHPEILFSLVELAFGINMPSADSLHAKVKIHIAEIALVVLGAQHPLTVLLKSEFDTAPRVHVTELVFRCIIDALTKTFGRTAYQTLVHQMGRSQFYARTGRESEGQKLISGIKTEWQRMYGEDSVLARLAEFELDLMRLQACRQPDPSVEAQAYNALLRIEVMSAVYDTKFTDKPSSNNKRFDRTPTTLALAHWFLLKKRYSLALHVYSRIDRASHDESGPTIPTGGRTLADAIADTVQDALVDVLSNPEESLVLPSRASSPASP